MNKFNDYIMVKDEVPTKNMFCDVVGVRPDGIFKEMKVFYRAKVKKEFFVDNRGIRRKRESGTGFVLQKPHKDFKIIAWKEHKELTDIVKALYGEQNIGEE